MEMIVLFGVLGGLIYLGILGWKRDRRWARILLILLLVAIACFAAFVALYLSAMAQADWSL